MPDKPLTVLTYAASASLAAVALVYFFNPNYVIDNEALSSASARKKGVVGLSNPANDCFINSVLQALAGIRELRLYLIRELHRRSLDTADIYRTIPERGRDGRPVDARKTLSLQSGEVTQGLKVMLDRLNERPLQRKTISAAEFIAVLERAFATRISKSQQDAQELLQIVAERLSEEYHAGQAARRRARLSVDVINAAGLGLTISKQDPGEEQSLSSAIQDSNVVESEAGFPLEGKTESVIECQTCRFTPKATPISFVMLTLPVPHKSSVSLSECFDSHFKTEYIDDYKCDKCRLTNALGVFTTSLRRAKTKAESSTIESHIEKIEAALADDPENPPKDVPFPDSKHAPTQKIARHSRITQFPNVLVIHLSRSIYDAGSISTKNLAKVSFPERLPLGGLVDRRNYKLLAAVSHKGTHNSGHYETFRRQHQYAPISTPHVPQERGPYSAANTPTPSNMPSPRASSVGQRPSTVSLNRAGSNQHELPHHQHYHHHPPSTAAASSSSHSTSSSSNNGGSGPGSSSTPPSAGSLRHVPLPPTSTPTSSTIASSPASPSKKVTLKTTTAPAPAGALASADAGSTTTDSQQQQQQQRRDSSATARAMSLVDSAGNRIRQSKMRRAADRWWRISDDKVKECRTGELLGMQREVYMLFYEIDLDGEGS